MSRKKPIVSDIAVMRLTDRVEARGTSLVDGQIYGKAVLVPRKDQQYYDACEAMAVNAVMATLMEVWLERNQPKS